MNCGDKYDKFITIRSETTLHYSENVYVKNITHLKYIMLQIFIMKLRKELKSYMRGKNF
jgi:hypothetical protein